METKINLTQWDDERHLSKMREVVNDCLTEFFERNKISGQSVENDVDAFGGIDLAVRITGYKRPTIYDLVHNRLIPHSKRRGRLYFSRAELEKWIRDGKRRTRDEILQDLV
jgi:excisionase family DNA binding protein